MMVPWSPTTFTPTSITNTLPRLQLYRVRQADDESLSVITSDGTRQIRSDQWTSLGSDALTIQYAAAQQHDNHVIIQLNTFTTLALAPQSALSLSYDDYVWSGSLEGTIARQTTDEVTRPMSMMTAGQSYILTGQ
ncbi:MAG: hypothetical protein H6766_05990 [Candidatus Peribacteria bacterium]|nr:MAG: hypothetical protein H6766_05990 [Candidatus Peribacteria bacterium]